MGFLKFTAVSVLLFVAGNFHSQSLTAVFSNIGENQGLSSPGVNCMLQDSRGFIWAGTSNGLNCYDGKTIRVFRHSRFDSTSICDNDIRTLVEDDKGLIWMGTKNGVSSLNPYTGRARNYVKDQSGPNVFSGAFLPIVFASPDRHEIWVCGASQIACFNEKKSCFIIDEKLTTLIKDARRIHAISLDNQNNFLVGSDRGLYIFGRSGKTPVQHFLPDLTVIAAETDRNGNRWLGTWGNGLIKIDKTGRIIPLRAGAIDAIYSADNIVGDLQPEGDVLWFTSNSGLFKVDTRDTSLAAGSAVVKVVPSGKSTEAPSFWGRLMLDRKNDLWIGTDIGMVVLFKQNQQFRTYPMKGHTTELLFDKQGAWGSSWYGEGLVRYDRDWNIVERYPKVRPSSIPPNYSQVSEIANFDSVSLLVATFNGLALFNKETKSIKYHYHKKGNANSICSDQLTAAVVTKSGDVWLGTYSAGLSKTDRSFRKFTHYNVDNSELTTNMIWKIIEDSKGTVWMATNRGICYYDPNNGKIIAIQELTENGRRVNIGSLNSILETGNGELWFCGDGVYRIKKNREIVFYDVEDGLPAPEINGLSEDESGNIWMSSTNGLSCFLAAEQKFRNYKTEDGLPALGLQNIFRNGNKLYAVAPGLLLAFDPAKLNYRTTVPNTYLLAASFSGKELTADQLSNKNMKFDHDENDLSVVFSSPMFQGRQNLSHQFRLEGADNRWNESGAADIAHYPNLPPGDYTFRVRALNKAQNQAGADAAFSFVIRPPFWATWWFRLLCLVFAAAIVFAFINIRKQRKVHLEEVRSRIARDLHDDVGSTLSSINILSETAKVRLDNDPGKTGKLISSIGEKSRGMLERMDDIVWSIRPENDNLDNVLARMRSFASETLEARSINCTFQTDSNLNSIQLPLEKRYDFFLVFKESVNNLAKYSGCTNAVITLGRSGNCIDLEVTDDGVGFNTASEAEGDGLKNMRRRAEALNARFQIESEPGSGTRVRLHVPLT